MVGICGGSASCEELEKAVVNPKILKVLLGSVRDPNVSILPLACTCLDRIRRTRSFMHSEDLVSPLVKALRYPHTSPEVQVSIAGALCNALLLSTKAKLQALEPNKSHSPSVIVSERKIPANPGIIGNPGTRRSLTVSNGTSKRAREDKKGRGEEIAGRKRMRGGSSCVDILRDLALDSRTEELATTATWGLKNLVFMASREVRMAVARATGLGFLKSLLMSQDISRKIQCLLLIRSLVYYDHMTDLFPAKQSQIEELLVIVIRTAAHPKGTPKLTENALYALSSLISDKCCLKACLSQSRPIANLIIAALQSNPDIPSLNPGIPLPTVSRKHDSPNPVLVRLEASNAAIFRGSPGCRRLEVVSGTIPGIPSRNPVIKDGNPGIKSKQAAIWFILSLLMISDRKETQGSGLLETAISTLNYHGIGNLLSRIACEDNLDRHTLRITKQAVEYLSGKGSIECDFDTKGPNISNGYGDRKENPKKLRHQSDADMSSSTTSAAATSGRGGGSTSAKDNDDPSCLASGSEQAENL